MLDAGCWMLDARDSAPEERHIGSTQDVIRFFRFVGAELFYQITSFFTVIPSPSETRKNTPGSRFAVGTTISDSCEGESRMLVLP